MIIIIGICIAIIVFLVIKLQQKKEIDTREYYEFQNKLERVKNDYNRLEEEVINAEKKYSSIIRQYQEATELNQEELNEFFAQQKETRQNELDNYFSNLWKEKQSQIDLKSKQIEDENKAWEAKILSAAEAYKLETEQRQQELKNETDFQEQRFAALLAPLRQYEKEQLEKLFYTIQIPEDYREDIDFLLTTVNQKVRHPDVISKLVWTEYIRPYILDTFKRVGIEAQPGIYKITNINSGKAYIGKSTDIKKRLADHFKSAVGTQSIADQAIHHAILQEGIWNWSIEYIIYCDKEKLNELEKYYIDFFKTQEFGYNKSSGG